MLWSKVCAEQAPWSRRIDIFCSYAAEIYALYMCLKSCFSRLFSFISCMYNAMYLCFQSSYNIYRYRVSVYDDVVLTLSHIQVGSDSLKQIFGVMLLIYIR